MDPSELVALIATLNPSNTPGRLAVIVRMGAGKLRAKLPALVEAVRGAGQVVTWVCDPMHGNTEDCAGLKTRRYDNIRAEVEAFFDVHDDLGTVPGGVHLEMTGDNVTECIGGGASVTDADLNSRYHTHCDPRLNAEQALEMAFYVSSRLRQSERSVQGCRLERSAWAWHCLPGRGTVRAQASSQVCLGLKRAGVAVLSVPPAWGRQAAWLAARP